MPAWRRRTFRHGGSNDNTAPCPTGAYFQVELTLAFQRRAVASVCQEIADLSPLRRQLPCPHVGAAVRLPTCRSAFVAAELSNVSRIVIAANRKLARCVLVDELGANRQLGVPGPAEMYGTPEHPDPGPLRGAGCRTERIVIMIRHQHFSCPNHRQCE
jgi:hypothetical protein